MNLLWFKSKLDKSSYFSETEPCWLLCSKDIIQENECPEVPNGKVKTPGTKQNTLPEMESIVIILILSPYMAWF